MTSLFPRRRQGDERFHSALPILTTKTTLFFKACTVLELLSSRSATAQGTPRTHTNTKQHEPAEPSPRAPPPPRGPAASGGTTAGHRALSPVTQRGPAAPSPPEPVLRRKRRPPRLRPPRHPLRSAPLAPAGQARGSVPMSHRCSRAVLPALPLPPARRGRAAASGPGQRRPHSGGERAGGCARTADTA